VIYGHFISVNGTYRGAIAILNLNGTVDAFNAPVGGEVRSVQPLPNGQFLIGGSFTAGGSHVDYLQVLSSTGLVQTNIGDEGVDGPILNMGQQSSGKWIIGGQFEHVLGVARNRVARFN
jgi:hypothetical protein